MLSRLIGAFALCLVLPAFPALAGPNVVASIKPLHSLVALVMGDLGTPDLLVSGNGSPHAYSLRPSEAGALQDADLVFWIGPELEVFLEQPLHSLSSDATIVELTEAPGLKLLPLREGGGFELHEDDGESEDDEDHSEVDAHIWLDPQNAVVMVHAIAGALENADPANATTYAANAISTIADLQTLEDGIAEILAPVADTPFIVFHDGYHYFESRFGLTAAGSITVSPDAIPGAQRLSEIRDRIESINAACVFAEPQFEPALVRVVTEGTGAKTGVLDPLGAEIPEGPDLYFDLLGGMARSFVECLGE